MRRSFKTGLSFGVTSGVITTLGTIVGLYSGTYSTLVIVGGILMIAISDAFSDSLGIHISKEIEKDSTPREVWEATLTTFFSKFFIAITFVIPVLFFTLQTAVIVAVVWGLLLLGFFSFYIAKLKKSKVWPVIFEHLLIAVVVIILAQLTGFWIRKIFL